MSADLTLPGAALLLLVGLLAGAVSAVAGGASFFTFPVLILSGLPPLAANATNFVALIPSNIAALPAYRAELRAVGRGLLQPLALGVLGGAAGAVLLTVMGAMAFEAAVPWLLLSATLIFTAAPTIRRLAVRFLRPRPGRRWIAAAGLFLMSVYGGYFGAGLGQIMLAALVLVGYGDFLQANALKNAVISAMSLIAAGIYVWGGAVSWPHAIAVAAGAAIGGYVGGVASRSVPQAVLRWGVIAMGTAMTVRAFWGGL
ncbi:sulfite exporter TauE/SafE family protein [Defluviimonas sp. WL0002]|uniref:Probable membrane transporter protein n=1 Tax=Albidovulum marisflavi TaxID=2984159 RepID=A0ABT2Z9U8_9RHOB|nr:sulfite exporter TauE/SafE family protein [Defluviimonas sp. WL0002]MCV2867881.1 sulfite exporter TauE/SafE family protein [Defluviimonas sp. WL0002]